MKILSLNTNIKALRLANNMTQEEFAEKIGTMEIDFIAEGYGYTEYYQVAQTVIDENTLARELKPLNSVKDHNPKYLLTEDITPEVSHNGIRQLNVIDWLLRKYDFII